MLGVWHEENSIDPYWQLVYLLNFNWSIHPIEESLRCGHRGKILNYQNSKVKLQRSDGVTFVVSSIFDQASQLLIEQQAKELSSSSSINSANPSNTSRTAASKIPFGKLNDAVGQKLFKDNNLWDDTPDEVSGRLNWPVESATSNSISCGLYAPADYNFLSVRPYSAVFYGSTENISSFSLVFANKELLCYN